MAKANGKYLNNIQDDLPAELQHEYRLVRESYQRHKAVQNAFETKLRDYLGNPNLVFSYRWGLSVTVGEPKPVKPTAKPKLSLTDWLEQRQ